MPRRSMFRLFAAIGILPLALIGPIDLVAAEPPLSSAAEVIDQYVDAHLASEGIQPAPGASEEVLIRRLTLDLGSSRLEAAAVKLPALTTATRISIS